jgi:hypothetical protein
VIRLNESFRRFFGFVQKHKDLSVEPVSYCRLKNMWKVASDIHLNNYQVRVLSGSPELDNDIEHRGGRGPRELVFGPPANDIRLADATFAKRTEK